jgi:hypothetical protein
VRRFLPLKDFRARRRVLTERDFAFGGDEVTPQGPTLVVFYCTTWLRKLRERTDAITLRGPIDCKICY